MWRWTEVKQQRTRHTSNVRHNLRSCTMFLLLFRCTAFRCRPSWGWLINCKFIISLKKMNESQATNARQRQMMRTIQWQMRNGEVLDAARRRPRWQHHCRHRFIVLVHHQCVSISNTPYVPIIIHAQLISKSPFIQWHPNKQKKWHIQCVCVCWINLYIYTICR